MRTLFILSLVPLLTFCGGESEPAESSSGGGSLGTTATAQGSPGVTTASAQADTSDRLTNEGTSDAAGSLDAVEGDATIEAEEVVEAPCELTTGMCPNACEHGDTAEGETCVTDIDCECGFCCGFGMCKPFDAMGCESFAAYSECLCPGETPASGPVNPGDETPWRVDPIGYMDGDCSSPTPQGSECNPYCQLGCPEGAHCGLVDDERFTCVSSGTVAAGEPCENSSECTPWLSCFGTFDEEVDTCRTVCDDDQECASGKACNLTIQLTSAFEVSFCDTAVLSCDLWMPECPEGMKCVAVGGQMICTESTWDGIEGYPCTELGDCAQGLLCIGSSCATICSLADTVPLGATSCAEQCPAGYQTVDQNLQLGRCADDGT